MNTVKWVNGCEGLLLRINGLIFPVQNWTIDIQQDIDYLLFVLSETAPNSSEELRTALLQSYACEDLVVEINSTSPNLSNDLQCIDDCAYSIIECTPSKERIASYFFVGTTAQMLHDLFQ